MAKNKDKIDDFDLDEFNLDFNFVDNPPLKKNDRSPILNAAANAGKGFKAAVVNRGFIERVMRKVLPRGVSDAYDQAQKVVTKGKALYNGASQELRPAYTDLTRAVNAISPEIRRKGGKSLADQLDKLFKQPPGKQSTPYDPDEDNLNRTLAEIYRVQAEDSDKKDIRNQAVEQLRDRTMGRRHTDLMGQQQITADGINQLVGYQKQYTTKYQQKMLELNFRQYYAQRDMLGTLQGYVKDTHTQLESIIRNTALPDIIKMQASEQFMNQARQRMFGKVQERVGDHFRNYTDKVFSNIEREVKGFTGQLTMGMQMGSQLLDAQRSSMEFDDGSEGSGLGGAAGRGLGWMLGNKLGKAGRRLLGRNQKVNDLGSRLGYYANNIPEALNELRENRRYYGDWRDQGMGALRRILPGPFQRNKQLEGQDELFGGSPAVYSNHTDKSITVVMPGLLSRILQSLEYSRTGKDPGLTVFNNERNAFTQQKQRTADIAQSVLGDKTVKGIQDTADDVVNRLDPENKLSPEARKALAKTLINQADTGQSFSPSKLATGHVDFSSDPRIHSELSGYFKNRYNVDSFGKTGGDAETFNRMSADSGSFRWLREAMPDVYATINRMVTTGNSEDLRALGILVPDPNDPRKEIIDYSFIQQRTSGGDWNITDAAPGTPNDRRRKRGRGGRGGRGGGDPIPPTPGPTPPSPTVNTDALLTGITTGFDKLIAAVNDSIGELGKTIVEESEKQLKAVEEFSARPAAEEAVVLLQKILKYMGVIGRGSRRGNRGGGAGEGDDEEEDADFDDEDEDYDIFDRARRGYGRGRTLAGRAYGAGKRFARRGYRAGKRMAGRVKNMGGRAYRFGKNKVGAAANWILGGKNVFQRIGDIGGSLLNAVQEQLDIYTSSGASEPVMTAAKMRAGHYFDFHTRRPIMKFSDIGGPVVDIEGNVVLTEDDIRNGLYGKNGRRIGNNLTRKAIGGLLSLGRTVMGIPKAYLDFITKVTKKTASLVRNVIDGPEDVYVKGEDSPRLLAIIMKRKGYLSKATRKIIERPSDIDGEVLDLQGNTVISSDDIQQGLVDGKGRPVVGLGGKLLRWAKAGFGLVGKAAKLANRVRKYAWDKTKKLGRAAGRGIKAVGRGLKGLWGGLTRGFSFRANIGFGDGSEGVEPIVSGLEAIYNLLDDRLPGTSKYRSGSWQEKLSRRTTPKEDMRRITEASKSNPVLKYLMMFGGAVMSGFAWLKSKFTDFFSFLTKGSMFKRGADALGDGLDAGDALDGDGRRNRRRRRPPRNRGGWLKRGARALWGATKTAGRFALAAAPVVGSALGSAGSALLSTGAAILGAITAPVALTVGAVVAVAAAGYFAYKYFKGRPGPLQRLRLAEYGFSPKDGDALKKVLEIEGYLMPQVQTSGSSASFQNLNTEELLKRAEIPDDPQQQRAFMTWFTMRFRPVFLRNVAELKKASSGVNLMEVDDKLDNALKVDFATASKTPPSDASQPYNIGGQPIPDLDPLTTGTKVIDEELAAIREEFGKYKKKEEPKAKAPGEKVAAAAAGLGIASQVGPGSKPTAATGLFQASGQSYVTPSEKTGGYEPGITATAWSPGANRLIDDLTAIRMRLYGLGELDISKVNALTTLETNVQDYVSINAEGKVSVTRAAESIYQENAGLFGRNPTDTAGQKEWIEWFNYRFLPVYVQFVNCIWGVNRSMKPGMAWKQLRPEDMLSIADILKGVKANTPQGAISVWAVPASAFVGSVNNDDITTIDANLTSLRNQIKANQFKEKTPNAAVKSGTQGSGTEASNAAVGSGTGKSGGGLWQSVKNWFGGGNNNSSNPVALGGASPSPSPSTSYNVAWGGGGGPVASMGTPIQQPGNGTGGDINQIPMPEGDGSWDALKKTIVAAAKMAGVDPGLMASMAFVESGFKAAVKPGTSNAQGLYQFIPSTWKTMLKRYASKYGIDPNTPPSDPRANALMGAEYLKENQKILENKLGRPVTGTDLYMAHFLGSGGGPRLLKAPSGDPATNHVDAAAANANRTIFFAGGRPKTVSEVIAWANKRIEGDGGKFAKAANELAGNSAALTAANSPTMQSPEAANDGASSGTQSADGSSAFEASQKQAAERNAAGTPASQPAPAPVGAGTGTTAASAAAPSTTGAEETPSVAPEKETSDLIAREQARSRQAKEATQVESANGMIQIMTDQLKVQEEMSESLKQLLQVLGNPGGGTGNKTQPTQPSRNGNTPTGSERVTPPINMKRSVK